LAVSSNLLGQPNSVPVGRPRSLGQFDLNLNIGLTARRKAPDLREATPPRNGCLQATPRFGYVAQEAEDIEEVRFPGSIGANYKDPVSQRHVDKSKVAPVL
jgi:hypothetical protein